MIERLVLLSARCPLLPLDLLRPFIQTFHVYRFGMILNIEPLQPVHNSKIATRRKEMVFMDMAMKMFDFEYAVEKLGSRKKQISINEKVTQYDEVGL